MEERRRSQNISGRGEFRVPWLGAVAARAYGSLDHRKLPEILSLVVTSSWRMVVINMGDSTMNGTLWMIPIFLLWLWASIFTRVLSGGTARKWLVLGRTRCQARGHQIIDQSSKNVMP